LFRTKNNYAIGGGEREELGLMLARGFLVERLSNLYLKVSKRVYISKCGFYLGQYEIKEWR
jgi:hypothetical protein